MMERRHQSPDLPGGYFDLALGDRVMTVWDRGFPNIISIVLDVEGPLDLPRLERAFGLLRELHPILGCTVSIDSLGARWRPGTGASPLFVCADEEASVAGALGPWPREAQMLEARLDPSAGPIERLLVLRSPGATRLVLSVQHGAMDARSVVNLADDLRRLYLALAADPDLRPPPDGAPRTLGAVLDERRLSGKQRDDLVRHYRREDILRPRSQHPVPRAASGRLAAGRPTYRALHISAETVRDIEPLRRRRGFTLNDVLLGLLARAWALAVGHGPSRTSTSVFWIAVDLRPHLGVTRGLGNLSGLELVTLSGLERLDALSAVEQASSVMRRIKSRWPGLPMVLSAEGLSRLAPGPVFNLGVRVVFARDLLLRRYDRAFTNIGVIPEGLEDFGEGRAVRAHVVAPVAKPPHVIFTGSGFRGAVTVVTGYREPFLTSTDVARIEESVLEDLRCLSSAKR